MYIQISTLVLPVSLIITLRLISIITVIIAADITNRSRIGLRGAARNTLPPKYTMISCITVTRSIMIINGLFCDIRANRLILAERAIKQFATPRNINRQKNALIKYTGVSSYPKKLFTLPDETTVLPGHMGATTIGDEKKYNPFL